MEMSLKIGLVAILILTTLIGVLVICVVNIVDTLKNRVGSIHHTVDSNNSLLTQLYENMICLRNKEPSVYEAPTSGTYRVGAELHTSTGDLINISPDGNIKLVRSPVAGGGWSYHTVDLRQKTSKQVTKKKPTKRKTSRK